MKKIQITWDGPYSLEQLDNGDEHLGTSIGVYQIYGKHPIYGSNVLLYIGKTVKQSFSKRIKQEEHWWDNSDMRNVQIYTGRLFSKLQEEHLIDDITLAEQILINTHLPAHNSSNINTISRQEEILKKIKSTRVINWHYYRDLMPEVSGDILLDENFIFDESYILEGNCK